MFSNDSMKNIINTKRCQIMCSKAGGGKRLQLIFPILMNNESVKTVQCGCACEWRGRARYEGSVAATDHWTGDQNTGGASGHHT